ncbi:MAG: protein-glutamate O-methyltransferase CheR [Desulfobacterales bacterium]|nr:protein-glutamate O-methyltransferase CheR [Desulfobacterales bacterium]
MIKITDNDFNLLSKYVIDISGIYLDHDKKYLVETRLLPILNELKCNSYGELYQKAKSDFSKRIEKQIIDAISTNETYFFRDVMPFELLKHKILPDIIDKKRTLGEDNFNIRIWSAACSTGQELYSIALIIKELCLDLRKHNIKLLGTDLSNAVVKKASLGKYNKFEVARGLTPNQINKYFIPEEDCWKIKDEIRSMVAFKTLNLMEPFYNLGRFDIVLCRNVAIYFTPENRKKLYEKIAKVIEPEGYLIIGSTETMINNNMFEPKKYLNSVFYALRGNI